MQELDELIELLEAEIPANPNSLKNKRMANRLKNDMVKYFNKLEQAFPYSKIASIYNRYVKEE